MAHTCFPRAWEPKEHFKKVTGNKRYRLPRMGPLGSAGTITWSKGKPQHFILQTPAQLTEFSLLQCF